MRNHFRREREEKKRLVESLILPHIDYCACVYDDLCVAVGSTIKSLINKCIRFVFNLKHDTLVRDKYKDFNWMTVATRSEYLKLCSLKRIIDYDCPLYLAKNILC